MTGHEHTPIDEAFQKAMRHSAEAGISLSVEEIVTLAERGRSDPRFEQKMAQVMLSTSAFEIYRAARMTRQKGALQAILQDMREGVLALPEWFAQTVNGMRAQPVPAYRSGASSPAVVDLNLANQSLRTGQALPEGVTIEEGEFAPGAMVTLTIPSETDDWSLDGGTKVRMKVLDSYEETRAEWADSHAEGAPVAAAVAYFSVGLFAEAEKLLGQWPADPELGTLAGLIRSTYEARRADTRRLF